MIAIMKSIRYALEAALVYILLFIFKSLPVDTASALGGWIGRTIGPRLGGSRKALRHIQKALIGVSPQNQKEAIEDMWENLGRCIAEYPHLNYIVKNRVTVKGGEIIKRYSDAGDPAILFGGHLGNWEVGACFVPVLFNQPLDMTYRAPNNPWVDKILLKARLHNPNIRAHPKSRTAGKALIEAIKNRRFVGVLLDQKYNEGVSVPFFGLEAMTNPVFVQLAQKYKCSMIPARCERTNGVNFEIEVFEPLSLFHDQDKPRDIKDVLADVHIHLEDWIKKAPGQWLWIHNRWDL